MAASDTGVKEVNIGEAALCAGHMTQKVERVATRKQTHHSTHTTRAKTYEGGRQQRRIPMQFVLHHGGEHSAKRIPHTHTWSRVTGLLLQICLNRLIQLYYRVCAEAHTLDNEQVHKQPEMFWYIKRLSTHNTGGESDVAVYNTTSDCGSP